MQKKEVSEKIKEVVKDDIWGSIKEFLDLGFHIGEGDNAIHLTIGIVLLLIVSIIIASLVLRAIRLIYTRKLDEIDRNKFFSVFKFINYVTYVIVFFVILGMTGINLTPVLAASAALLVGLGLALQELFQDIIGGMLIIIDKSLMVGDIVEVEDKVGKVIEIKLRTTRAVTRDDKVIIIPNHKFISNSIYNYTQNGKTTREYVKVGVAYGSDTEKVKELLLQSISLQNGILKKPKPFVAFEDFGDSALIFSVYFYVNKSFEVPIIKSQVRFTIDSLFRENKVTIPFPQRDVHLFQSNK